MLFSLLLVMKVLSELLFLLFELFLTVILQYV